jgi:hypothetical protein
MIKKFKTLAGYPLILTWLLIVFDVDSYQPTFILRPPDLVKFHSPMELVPILFIAFFA